MKITTEIKMIYGLDPDKIYIFEFKNGVDGRVPHNRLNAFRLAMKSAGIKGIAMPEGHLKSIRCEGD